MKIKMMVSLAGADFALSPGEVTDRFGDEEAMRLVQADYAVVIAGAAIETAVKLPAAEIRNADADDKETLVAEAEALGIDVDKRWGAAKLKSAIEAAKAKAAEAAV